MVRTRTPRSGAAALAARRAALPAIVVAAALAMAAPGGAHAQPDRWDGTDKAWHVGASAPFGALGAALAGREGASGERLLYGTLVGSLPGLAKELADARRPGQRASGRDLTANLVGAALGALLADCCLIRPLARGDRVDGVGVEYRVDF